ncbi:endothelial zinc finger protein induced by tumor necrosis factor alpha-like [Pygocentrus nattereri]|uniref:C2H2-type domain-containing protein n=1 Tax=Pygocentrus nattereri TaxID=42514 RepID=A0A3B4EPT1_PYGNA|nr:endothelial zinc finger protein induced by tumor necrosis factor alpha-like [Pygocentrus nattereri]
MGSPLPFSSLRLLVPPLRLMSAFMWQVVQQQKLEHFNELEEYILLLTKMFPKILSERQKTALVMGLRAKMILETCKGEVPINMETIKEHLQTVESKAAGSEVESLQCKLLKLLISLLEDPVKKEHFFQEVFPLEYGPDFDKALQVLVGHFLSRLEQLLPVPNFKQAALWLSSAPTGWENLVQTDWNPRFLLPLLRSDYQGTLETNGLPSVVEDRIISTLSLSPLTDVAMPRESNTDDQSELSSCLESSSQDVNQDMNQDVSQENKTEALSPKILNFNQIEGHSDIVVELESSRCGLQEEGDLIENDVEESSVCEVEEVTMETSQSESEDVQASTEPDRPENEASTEVAGPEPISEISGTNADLRDVDEGGVEAADKASAISAGPLLKVVVPRHLISVIKQVQLPSVSLSRCMCSESGSLKLGPEVLKTSSSSSPSPSSGNGCKTQTKRSQLRRQHQCSECRLSFRCQVELRAHMRRHTEKGPYKCHPCKLNFKTYFQASVHQRKWHSKITYSCAHCDQTFKSMKAWLMHRREHKVQTVHRCADCGKECISLQSLVNHSKVHNHLVSERLLDSYKCIACGETFSQKSDFLSHMETHKAHGRVRTDQNKAARPSKRPPGECRFCGQMFSVIELRNHLKTHPEFRPHQCDHCGKCFATLQGLLAHISNHTGEKPHSCLSCGKKFFSRSQLKSHMRSHSKERPYCCSYCGKCFHSLGNLTIHTRLHTGEKPYVCLECGKAFSSAGCLQVHRRCHTGEKPYPCSICGRSFIVSSHRTIHMRSHTGLRPYVCEVCGRAFVRRRCLNEHLYSHSDVKPFMCSACPKSFTRRGHLKRHMRCHGGDQSSENI